MTHATTLLIDAERAFATALELLRDARVAAVASLQRLPQGGAAPEVTDAASCTGSEHDDAEKEGLREQLRTSQVAIDERDVRIKELDAANAKLRDENAGFYKVSRIVFYENENTKLRKRIAELEAALALATSDCSSMASYNEGARCEAAVGPDEVIEVYEKKIRGTIYYVSSSDGIVYRRLIDGSVGEDVGTLVKDGDGRTRLVLRVEQAT